MVGRLVLVASGRAGGDSCGIGNGRSGFIEVDLAHESSWELFMAAHCAKQCKPRTGGPESERSYRWTAATRPTRLFSEQEIADSPVRLYMCQDHCNNSTGETLAS